MDSATSLFIQGLSWGIGVGCCALGICMVWGSFVKSVNSL